MLKKHSETKVEVDAEVLSVELETETKDGDILSPEAEALAKEIENFASETQKEVKKRKFRLRRKKSDKFKHTMPVVLRVLLSIVLLMAASICFAWFLVWRTSGCDVETAMEFVHEKSDLFAYNILVIFCIMSVLAAVTWRVFFSVGVSFSLISIITYVNMEKVRLRDTPLLPEDLLLTDQVGGIVQFVDVWEIVRLIGGIMLILAGCILLENCARRVIGRDSRRRPHSQKVMIASRVAFTSMALAISGIVIGPVYNQTTPEWVDDMQLLAWNQLENYENNGFLIGFLYNFGRKEIAQPETYHLEKIAEIATKYQNEKAADDENRKPLSEIADNVIVILNETFYDPELLDEYYSHRGGDVVPNLHKIFEKYPSGYMYSSEYGGGTANVEFEVFTGLSNYWARSFPYVAYVTKQSSILSAASWAKDDGFATTAMHSYDGRMYKRNIVYPIFGFDDFIDEQEMKYQETEHYCSYINDQSVYREILDIIEGSDEPQMLGAVTMQNHIPYDCASYPKLDFTIINQSNHAISSSFQSLHEADKYLGEFIAALDELEEKTVVLWFGDHAAGILDAYYKSDDPEEVLLSHLTPYFIYANFEIGEGDEDAAKKSNAKIGLKVPKKISGVDLPVVTPNCIQNEMYDILGAKKPALFYLVGEVCKAEPILAQTFLMDSGISSAEALRDYELINYDILGGKHYWDGE